MAGQILEELSHPHVAGFHIAAAGAAREELVRIGFVAHSWTRLAEGLRPVVLDPEDQQIGLPGMDVSRQQQTPCTHTSWRARSDHG